MSSRRQPARKKSAQKQSRNQSPKNKHDARVRKSKAAIRKTLQSSLSRRRMNLRVVELCKDAHITRPTFYRYWRDIDEALRQYETLIQQKFWRRITIKQRDKKNIFVLLLCLMHDEQEYFLATIPNANFFLLVQLFKRARPLLVGQDIGDISYKIYVHQLISLIQCWVIYENFDMGRVPHYATMLTNVRVMSYDIKDQRPR